DTAAARRAVALLRQLGESGDGLLELGVHYNQAFIALEEDEPARAVEQARLAVLEMRRAGFEFAIQLSLQMLAVAQVSAGELCEAARTVEEGLARARSARSLRLEYAFRLVDAARALAAGEEDALGRVRRALGLGRDHGLDGPLPGMARALLGRVCLAAA